MISNCIGRVKDGIPAALGSDFRGARPAGGPNNGFAARHGAATKCGRFMLAQSAQRKWRGPQRDVQMALFERWGRASVILVRQGRELRPGDRADPAQEFARRALWWKNEIP